MELWDANKEEIHSKKLDMEIIDITTAAEDCLLVTQSHRIEAFDLYSIVG